MKQKLKDKFQNLVVKLNQFVFTGLDGDGYEPLAKVIKYFWNSLLLFVIMLVLSIITFVTKSQYESMAITILIISLIVAIVTLASGLKMRTELEQGVIKTDTITVIKANKINLTGKIEAVTDNEENCEYVLESDIKLKKDRKYKIYYTDKNVEKVITYAKQISKNKAKKED